MINEGDYSKKHRRQEYKEYNTRFSQTIFKFLMFIFFLEFYFVFSYAMSNSFFTKIKYVSDEVCYIAKRTYSNSLLYKAEMEMIGDLSSTKILGNNSKTFVSNYIDSLIGE